MKYIVLFNYSHYDLGGYGWKIFNSKEEAILFIEGRLTNENKLENFTLAEFNELKLKAVEVIKKIITE